MQPGEWVGKMTFPEVNADLRTDAAFNEMRDVDHHKGPSPYHDTGVKLQIVSQFLLDYMHLVCLGVVKRLMLLWMKGPLGTRFSSYMNNEVSEMLKSFKKHIPREFSRKPRSVAHIDRWKATEFRQFCYIQAQLY